MAKYIKSSFEVDVDGRVARVSFDISMELMDLSRDTKREMIDKLKKVAGDAVDRLQEYTDEVSKEVVQKIPTTDMNYKRAKEIEVFVLYWWALHKDAWVDMESLTIDAKVLDVEWMIEKVKDTSESFLSPHVVNSKVRVAKDAMVKVKQRPGEEYRLVQIEC